MENALSIATPDRLCQQILPDGRRCRARRISSSSYCFFHDPESKGKRMAAQRAGGMKNKNRMARLPELTPDAPLAEAKDVSRLLAQTINQVRRGELDPKVANAVGYLAGILLKSIQESEIETRVAALEAATRLPSDSSAFSFEEN
jgi:hypothetical protein